MVLRYSKVRENAKSPHRANPTDAGMDLFYTPEDESVEYVKLPPNGSLVFPTGIKFDIPAGSMIEVKNKSGIAAKRQLLVGACVVDSGYQGEVFVNLHNVGITTQYIKAGTKIAQAVMIPIIACELQEELESELYIEESGRGDGALGSTGLE